MLIEHFRQTFNRRFNKSIAGFSDDVLDRFMDYPWPGNIRELEHVIEHAFILCHADVIAGEHLPPEIRICPEAEEKQAADDIGCAARDRYAKTVDALAKAGGNKAKAARLLGIDRRTLYRRIEKYNASR